VRAPQLVLCTGPQLSTAAATGQGVTVDQTRRTISGLLVPYGPVGATSQGRLRFRQGSLSWSDPKRVKLLIEHNQREVVGYATELTDTAEGLRGTFHVPEGAAGDLALAEAASGLRDGLSVGVQLDDATATRLRRANGSAVDAVGQLREVSSVSVPAFDSARVDNVAASTTDLVVSAWHDEHPNPHQEGNAMPCSLCGQNHAPGVACPTPAPAPAVTAPATATAAAAPATGQAVDTTAAAGLTPPAPAAAVAPPASPAPQPAPAPLAVAGAAYAVASEPATYTFDADGPSLVVDAWRARMHGDSEAAQRLHRFNAELAQGNPASVMALAAVAVTADVPEFIGPTTYRPDLLRAAIDRARPIVSRIGTTPIRNAQPFTIPVEGEFDGVADHVEGTAHVPEGTLTAGDATLTPKAASGAYRISRELVDQSNPALDRIALRAMVRDYRRYTEGKTVAAFAAAAGAGTVVTGYMNIRAALAAFVGDDDLGADELFASKTYLAALLGETDAQDRPLLGTTPSPGGAGTIRAGYTGAIIDQTEVVRAGSLPAGDAYAVQNDDVLLVESPVQQFRFDEVEGPGIIKLALWAYFGAAVLDATGVVRFKLA